VTSKNSLLGKKLQCRVTGFKGVATGFAVYLNGCVSYLVTPRADKEGKAEGQWIDEERLKVLPGAGPVRPKLKVEIEQAERKGGPQHFPSKRSG
jgi:hypothetical protein